MEEPMSGPLWELMLCSEAEDGQIPIPLRCFYRNAACTNAGDALMVAIHLLMLETGYFPLGAEAKVLTMPEDWRSASAYKLHYTHPLCAGGSATLACVPMGKFIVVNGNLKINDKVNGVKKLQLSTDTYILFPEKDNDAASVYKDLRKLSRIVKDQLVYPLLATTRQVLNLPDFFGLLVLPLELKVRIFRLLDVHSLVYLSATCKELLAEIEDPLLWRFLCIRDFRVSVQRSQETDWKSLYKKKHKQKLEALHLRRMLLIPYPTSSLPFHPTPYYPGPFPSNQSYPPGIIGGRYDQRPILPIVGDPNVSLIPGVGPISGRFFPFTPHLDPSRPFSEPNPMCPGPRSLRPSRGRGPDVRRDFI
ncbi:hypothetical protein GDO86_005048 [Hymenochirus boettgeri]|uniref:F-box domain-containing protein n=1 Tax=Hymenochirus boettgeri TaxID=247094 RepID=A0A8T2J8F3_9PIPI|nr:hypothetical protein GDO86_005048 [Hymenochirus boettgeri]